MQIVGFEFSFRILETFLNENTIYSCFTLLTSCGYKNECDSGVSLF